MYIYLDLTKGTFPESLPEGQQADTLLLPMQKDTHKRSELSVTGCLKHARVTFDVFRAISWHTLP